MPPGTSPHFPTRTGARPPVRVIVCGEPARGDDAAAFLAIERLPADARALAEIELAGQLDVQQLLDVPADVACVIVDAAVGVPAGTVVVLPLEGVATGGGPSPHSSHSLPPDQVLALAATLRGRLPEGSFVGLGGRSFGLGDPPSTEVEEALAAFAEALAGEIRRLAG